MRFLLALSLCVVTLMAPLTAQNFIFEETFDSRQSFDQWQVLSLTGDDYLHAGWEWSSSEGLEGSGSAVLTAGYDDMGYSCLPINEMLRSPDIALAGNEATLRYRIKALEIYGGYKDKQATYPAITVLLVDSATQQTRSSFTVNIPSFGEFFEYDLVFPVDINEIPNMYVGFSVSTLGNNGCGYAVFVDEVTIRADRPPETEIVLPAERLTQVRKGQPVQFQGSAWDPDGDGLTYMWRFCSQGDECLMMGKQQTFSFPETGVYEVQCWGEDDRGLEDPTPDRRYIRVVNNIRPQITETQVFDGSGQTIEFRDGLAFLNAGDVLTFVANAQDEDSSGAIQLNWKVLPIDETYSGVTRITQEFPNPGLYVVGVVAVDSEGARNFTFWKLIVLEEGQNIPPLAEIVSPEPFSQIIKGSAFDICGSVIDPDTTFDSCTTKMDLGPVTASAADGVGQVFWALNNGAVYEGIGVSGVRINREGRYQVSMLATDGQYADLKTTQFSVIDPDNLAQPSIIYPAQSIRIQPGQRVYFEATVRSGSISDKFFRWKIKKTGAGGWTDTVQQTMLGYYRFEEEGIYNVTVTAVNPANQDLSRTSDIRVIRVESIPEISGNTSIDNAAELPTGFFQDNQADGVRYYRIALRDRGQSLKLQLSYEGNATVSLLDSSENVLNSKTFTGQSSFQVRGLIPGNYFIRFEPDTSTKQALASDLAFGLSIDVTNAGLYFPDVERNSVFDTSIGLVNPFSQELEVELLAYDKNGGLLEQTPVRLGGMGRFSSSVSDLFPNSAGNIGWVRVDANGQLSGYTFTKSHDGKESYAMHGAEKLASDLYVPHIAQKTQQWYTVARVVNGSSNQSSSAVVAGNESKALDVERRFSKDDFNMLDKFEGNLPQTEWGVFSEQGSKQSLAGAEIFGKVDGNRQTAGLVLDDNGQDNPNFTFIRNDIYFTHIARSVEQFWTGLAFVNTEATQATFKMIAYGDGGAKIGEKNFSLGPGDKIVDVAENILDGIGSPANVDWVKIQADQGIVGYELFGTHDNRRLAGLEGITGVKNKICFPHLDTTGLSWHGISVVNVTDSPCELTLKLVSDAGVVIAETQKSLNANEKLVSLVTDLFGLATLPSHAGWVACEADQLIAGFELFGDLAGDTMAAVIAR